MILAKVKGDPNSYSINIDGTATSLSKVNELNLCKGNNSDIKLDTDFELSVEVAGIANLEEIILVIKYV